MSSPPRYDAWPAYRGHEQRLVFDLLPGMTR